MTHRSSLQKQAAWLQHKAEDLKRVDHRFFLMRVFTFVGGWVFTLLARFFIPGSLWLFVLIAFVFGFILVVLFHQRLDRGRRKVENMHTLVKQQIARTRLDWANMPDNTSAEPDDQHPYAADLNLMGKQSLLHLVNSCVSQGGTNRLRQWLLEPSLQMETIHHRQLIQQELLNRPAFRRNLMLPTYLADEDQQSKWDGMPLLAWLAGKRARKSLLPVLLSLTTLAVLNISLFIANLAGLLPPLWQFSLVLYFAIYLFKHKDYSSIFEDAYHLARSLEQIKPILEYLETYPYFGAEKLAALTVDFREKGKRPSTYLRNIALITSASSLQNNQILALLLNALLPWDLFFAWLFDRFRRSLENVLPNWLDTWYEIEALNALANFGYLNPDYNYPELIENQTGAERPVFIARQVGHPLLSKNAKVRNDFQLDRLGDVAIVTGSNMSGKSTFLRTLGVNLALAYAGGPVDADGLETIRFRLFSCIQVSDSLSEGFSYFYAEVRRLKSLLQAVEGGSECPVFFLIDEIFRGTNNRERRIGSQSYIRTLVKGRGTGVISTHDLALSKLADESQKIENYNFSDEVRDGMMVFDYRLRPGPSPSTNALRIMEMEGLPVEFPVGDPDEME